MMNAQQLLDRLLTLSAQGYDLAEIDVQAEYRVYDPSIQYDDGYLKTLYTDSVDLVTESDQTSLVLR